MVFVVCVNIKVQSFDFFLTRIVPNSETLNTHDSLTKPTLILAIRITIAICSNQHLSTNNNNEVGSVAAGRFHTSTTIATTPAPKNHIRLHSIILLQLLRGGPMPCVGGAREPPQTKKSFRSNIRFLFRTYLRNYVGTTLD